MLFRSRHRGVDPVRAARFLLLAWVAGCDGELDASEGRLLEELGGSLGAAAGELSLGREGSLDVSKLYELAMEAHGADDHAYVLIDGHVAAAEAHVANRAARNAAGAECTHEVLINQGVFPDPCVDVVDFGVGVVKYLDASEIVLPGQHADKPFDIILVQPETTGIGLGDIYSDWPFAATAALFKGRALGHLHFKDLVVLFFDGLVTVQSCAVDAWSDGSQLQSMLGGRF